MLQIVVVESQRNFLSFLVFVFLEFQYTGNRILDPVLTLLGVLVLELYLDFHVVGVLLVFGVRGREVVYYRIEH